MKNTILTVALALASLCVTSQAQQYAIPANFYIEAVSPDPGNIGKQVTFDGTPCTSANAEESLGILMAVEGTDTYVIASPMWYTGNAYVTFTGTATDYPAGAWLVLDGSGNHVLETDPGNQVRVARVADHDDNVYKNASLAEAVVAVPVHPHYASFPKPSVDAPSAGNAITVNTTGTAFQPRADGPCHIVVTASLAGILGVAETVTVQMSDASGGTYTTVSEDTLLLGALGSANRSISLPVPSGWWVRVNRSGGAAAATYTRWNQN